MGANCLNVGDGKLDAFGTVLTGEEAVSESFRS